MRRAGLIALAALAAASTAGAEPPPAGRPVLRPRFPRPQFQRPPVVVPFRAGPGVLRRRFGLRPLIDRPGIGPNVPPYLLPPPPPDEFLQPEGPGVSPLIEGDPGDLPALSHGFHLSVTVGAGQTFAAPATLERFIQVGQALGRCFAPPPGLTWGSVTLRVSFRRDGSVFGLPRVPYTDAGTPEGKTDLAQSLLAGLKRCTPLPLSPSLGAAVAGEIFAIRFIHEDKR